MYMMGTLLRHGSEAQKRAWLPQIASGELRLQAFAVTEPDAGSDTTRIQTQRPNGPPTATASTARRYGPRAPSTRT